MLLVVNKSGVHLGTVLRSADRASRGGTLGGTGYQPVSPGYQPGETGEGSTDKEEAESSSCLPLRRGRLPRRTGW